MNDIAEPRSAALNKLSIARDRRPTGLARGRWLLLSIIAVVGVIAAGAVWWWSDTTGRNVLDTFVDRPVEVTLMEIPDLGGGASGGDAARIALVGSGRIVSDRQVNVATKVSGQIVELDVEQGDTVVEGQVLARVEDVVYRAQRDEAAANVARNQHAIARARTEESRARATVLQLRAEFEFEQRNYERVKGLIESGQASEFEFNNTRNRYEAAQAAHDAAAAAAKSAAAAVELAQAELTASEAVLRLLQKRVDDCAIRAPISGVILQRNAQVGDFLAAEGGRGANANAQLVSIADMTLLRVEIDVSERDVGRLSADQPARITPDADRERAFAGKVMWIDPVGNYAKATVQVKVRILEPGPQFRVEGSAKVEFLDPVERTSTTPAKPASLWLPLSCVKAPPGSDEAEVFTVVKDRAVAVPVKVGARTDKTIEVLSGVYPGMRIVAEKVEELRGDARVKVLKTVRVGDL
ncbi:MAG: efflux RND transporter periplasmic adaptor subunit [Phycisphaerales bacterium]|nr:efflux RND transporter periplasmic adaptor subunit [Phycisphaerales bacterium]